MGSTSHHFLPQIYLRQFTNPDRRKEIFEYDKETRTVKSSTPKLSGCEDNYHAFVKKDGQKDTDTIEKRLNKDIENKLPALFEAIRHRRILNQEEWDIFHSFVGSMLVRVPNYIANHRTIVTALG